MKIQVGVRTGADVSECVARVLELEQAGVDIISVPEAYGVDAVSILAFLAARTRTAQLMSGILPIYSRTPALLAMTAVGLDWVSGGRFILGLGASGPQVVEGFHGVPYDAPLGRTREIVEICRSAWRREPLSYAGRYYTIPLRGERSTGLGKPLRMITHPIRVGIPVYLAALGEKNVQLAAELAEGWLPFLFAAQHAEAVWGSALREGRARRADELPSLEICAGGAFAIGKDVTALRDAARPQLALYVGGMGAPGRNFYNRLVRAYGYAEAAENIQQLYLSGHKREAEAAVPERLLEETSVIGDPGYVRERLQHLEALGVTVLKIDPVGPDPVAELRALREIVDGV
jgi:F420-dependent oxidoreductase-like protein